MRNLDGLLSFFFSCNFRKSCTFHFFKIGYNKYIYMCFKMKKCRMRGAIHSMSLFLIILVMIAFLAAIFTAGYNDKPGQNK
jgi:hypothetical protein